MSNVPAQTTVEVLGKTFQIKCEETEIENLQKASHFLDEKMRYFRKQGIVDFEKLAVIAALNIVHQLLNQDTQNESHLQKINQRLQALQTKMQQVLLAETLVELACVE